MKFLTALRDYICNGCGAKCSGSGAYCGACLSGPKPR